MSLAVNPQRNPKNVHILGAFQFHRGQSSQETLPGLRWGWSLEHYHIYVLQQLRLEGNLHTLYIINGFE